MLIHGFQKSSLIDFPKKIAAVVFTQGCNFSCPYCHNPELIRPMTIKPVLPDEIFEFLKTRTGKLDGVVITGGEPTLQKDLPEFIREIKNLGFEIKLDTNGSNPDMVQELLSEGLIHYIAMDIKTSFQNYKKVAGEKADIEKIKETFEIIIKNAPDYEFRTTVVKSLLCYNDFVQIKEDFKAFRQVKKYCLQKFQTSKHLDENYINAQSFSNEKIKEIQDLFKDIADILEVR